MIVIKSVDEMLQDFRGSLDRELSRLNRLKEIESSDGKYALGKKALLSEISNLQGKVQTYEHCIEIAEAYKAHLDDCAIDGLDEPEEVETNATDETPIIEFDSAVDSILKANSAGVNISKNDWEKALYTELNEEQNKKPKYIDIGTYSMEDIQSLITDWLKNLKEGDDVYVMYRTATHGWQVHERSFSSKIISRTEKQVRISYRNNEEASFVDMKFHVDGGFNVLGVSGSGDYSLIPPFLNPADLSKIQAAKDKLLSLWFLSRARIDNLIEASRLIDNSI